MKPIVYITPMAYSDLYAYSVAARSEIGGLGEVRVGSRGRIVIERIFLVRQFVTRASCDFDEEDLSRIMAAAAATGRLETIRVWWHSHNDMRQFLSPTDMTTVCTLLAHAPWFITLVTNRAISDPTSILTTIHIQEPQIDVEASLQLHCGDLSRYEVEIAKLVTEKYTFDPVSKTGKFCYIPTGTKAPQTIQIKEERK